MTKKREPEVGEERRPLRLRQMAKDMLDEAARDPEAFVESARAKIRKAAATARAVKQEIQNDPDQPMKTIRNGFIQGIARRLKLEFFDE